MCGISGVLTDATSAQAISQVSTMNLGIHHRGPDAQATFSSPETNLYLGHTRLSIIDLEGSAQPMTSASGRYTIAFNGEIFNFRELREETPYPYQTEGDTETILALWEIEQEACIRRLRGQFAFAIWDNKESKVSLAVDAFGILPLYVAERDGQVLFGSGMCALNSADQAFLKNDSVIPALLAQRAVSAPETPYVDVRRLPPGSLWTLSDGEVKEGLWKQPWVISPAPGSRQEKISTLLDLLNRAADRAVTADVEIGVFLSGGLDSAIMAKLAQDRLPYRMRSYTASWSGNTEESELQAASALATYLGLNHTNVVIDAQAWFDALKESSKYRDAPHSEPADAVFYLLAKRAAKDVKVVVTGEGSDELFGGYPKYKVERFAQMPLVRPLARLANVMGFRANDERVSRLLQALGAKTDQSRWATYFATTWPKSFGVANSLNQNLGTQAPAESLRVRDLNDWLAPLLLDRADRMAMANSLEVRPIFLDFDIANFALGLTGSELVHRGKTKALLRDVAKLILPENIANVRKRGFPMPLDAWLITDLYDEVEEILTQACPPVDAHVSLDQRRKLLNDHKSGRCNNTLRLFTLLSTILWLDQPSTKA